MSMIQNVHEWIEQYIKQGAWKPVMPRQSGLNTGTVMPILQFLYKMHACFGVAQMQDSLFASGYTGTTMKGNIPKSPGPVQLCNQALSNFGDYNQADTTVTSMNNLAALLADIGYANVTQNPDGSINITNTKVSGGAVYKDVIRSLYFEYGKDGFKSLQSQLKGQFTLLSSGISEYKSDLEIINGQGSATGSVVPDLSEAENAMKSLSGAISAINNLFTGASKAASMQQKSLQTSDTAVMTLIGKMMQALHNIIKTMTSNMSRGG